MRSLFRILGLDAEVPVSRDTETVRRIARELDRLPPAEARYLACFAYVLARLAHVDQDVSDEEVAAMEKIVRDLSDLGEAKAALVVQIAKHQAIGFGGTENYIVTRQFRESSTREQRLGLVRCLFAVAAADREVSELENTEISMIGSELGLTGPELAAARSAYREYLSVLKSPGPA